MDEDVAYHLKREAEERLMAAAAGTDSPARHAHAELADRHADAAWSIEERSNARRLFRPVVSNADLAPSATASIGLKAVVQMLARIREQAPAAGLAGRHHHRLREDQKGLSI